MGVRKNAESELVKVKNLTDKNQLTTPNYHVPVLYKETLEGLNIPPNVQSTYTPFG